VSKRHFAYEKREKMTSSVTPQMDAYATFTTALAHASTTTMAEHVSEDFWARFDSNSSFGTGVMNFDQFVEEIERLRIAFPDLACSIDIIEDSETDNTLYVRYDMTVTFDGILVSRDGQQQFSSTGGERMVIQVVDTVTFTPELLIQSFVVETNIGEVWADIFPM
jgi:hypothetical protein